MPETKTCFCVPIVSSINFAFSYSNSTLSPLITSDELPSTSTFVVPSKTLFEASNEAYKGFFEILAETNSVELLSW